MKALVVYSSKTGNTRKLAQVVYGCLTCEKEICAVESAPDPIGFDLVALGFWLQGGKPDTQSADFMGKIGAVDVFLFATHGAAADSQHAAKAMDHAKSLLVSARVRGTFNCPGAVEPAHLAKVRAKDPRPVWVKDAPGAVGRPNEADLRALKAAVKAAVGPGAA